MPMKRISIQELEEIAGKYKLQPCIVKGTTVVNIRKKSGARGNYEDINWAEFDRILKRKGLAVYKASESDFLKIMKK